MSEQDSAQASRLDPEQMPRRDFLGLTALGAAGVTLGFACAGMARLPNAAVSASPSRRFKVNLPETLANGRSFVPPGRSVAIFRDGDGVYAISLVCTHLGCIVKHTGSGFECPCHGSRFAADGAVVKGPAPQPLPWRKITGSAGAYIVDESVSVPAGTKVNA
jgi:Rieske Fe-S protein